MFRGHREVVDADLADYFGSIPHAELLKSVARRIVDGEVLRLIKLRLKTPIEERDADGKRRLTGGKRSRYGMPQSGVVTPRTQKVTSALNV
jgi:RNA-directed DNA polymerase